MSHFLRQRSTAAIMLGMGVVLSLTTGSGCIELGLVQPPGGNGQDNSNDNGNGGNNVDEPREAPRVRLTASNLTPQVNEELILRCELLNEPGGAVTYGFQAAGGASQRFQVDPVAGTARFIVQEVDVGAAINVTCIAANELGTSPESNAQIIVATPSTTPDPVFP